MPLCYYDANEWYPVLSLTEDPEMAYENGHPAEFTEEEIAHINKVFEDFAAVQKLISERFKPSQS